MNRKQAGRRYLYAEVEPTIWMLERPRDPTFPRFYGSAAQANAVAEAIKIDPLPVVVPLHRRYEMYRKP